MLHSNVFQPKTNVYSLMWCPPIICFKNAMMVGSLKGLVKIHYALNTLVEQDGSKLEQLVYWSLLRSLFLKTNKKTPICTITLGQNISLVDGSMAQIETKKVVGSIQRETR